MMEWISVKDRLPKTNGKYFVRKGKRINRSDPMVAIFISTDGDRWLIQLNGTYWEVVGITEWAYITPPKEGV